MKIKEATTGVMIGTFGILLASFSWGLRLGWFAFHIMTVLVMYGRHGVVGAIVGFFLPFLSEAYTIAMVLWYNGLNNFYIISLAILIGISAIPYVVALIVDANEHKE